MNTDACLSRFATHPCTWFSTECASGNFIYTTSSPDCALSGVDICPSRNRATKVEGKICKIEMVKSKLNGDKGATVYMS